MKDFVCFFDPDDENGYMSNFYPARFTVDGMAFSSLEQFMMYRKSLCFGDTVSAEKVMAIDDARAIKALGREVANYDDRLWNGVRQIVVYEGLLAKFSQNRDLKDRLLATGDALIVECAASDCIWSIGLSVHDPDRLDQTKWRGANLLGYTLMMVRAKLAEEIV